MKILHVVPGLGDPANGIAAMATRLADEQRAMGDEVSVSASCPAAGCPMPDVVFVHSMWTPPVLRACHAALRAGTPLVRVPHGCLNPAALRHSAWKKALVSPLERHYMRRAACVLVTTETEKAAVERWVGGAQRVEVVGMGVDDLLTPDFPDIPDHPDFPDIPDIPESPLYSTVTSSSRHCQYFTMSAFVAPLTATSRCARLAKNGSTCAR